jgi:hypothetical protein
VTAGGNPEHHGGTVTTVTSQQDTGHKCFEPQFASATFISAFCSDITSPASFVSYDFNTMAPTYLADRYGWAYSLDDGGQPKYFLNGAGNLEGSDTSKDSKISGGSQTAAKASTLQQQSDGSTITVTQSTTRIICVSLLKRHSAIRMGIIAAMNKDT